MTLADLRELVARMPPGSSVTLSRDALLEAVGAPDAPGMPADLNVAELGARLRRSHSTVRGWCEKGRFAGAFKLEGRDWRIPPAAVESFLEAQRRGRGDHPELGDWRKARRKGASRG